MVKPIEPNDDQAHEQLQTELKNIYQQSELELPPVALDAAIIEQARRHSQQHHQQQQHSSENADSNEPQKVVKLSWWKQHKLGLSSAASVVIVAGLFISNPQFTDPLLLETAGPETAQSQLEAQPATMSMQATPSEDSANEPQAETSLQSQAVAPQVQAVKSKTVSPEQQSALASASVNAAEPAMTKASTSAEGAMPAAAPRSLNTLTPEPARAVNNTLADINRFSANESQLIGSAQQDKIDTAEKAFAHIVELTEQEQLAKARASLADMELRFPEVLSPQHPLHDNFQKLKQQLFGR